MLLLPGGPERPVVAVVGLVVRRLTVVVALADVRLLASARGAQRGRQRGGAGNTTGTEEGTHIWSRVGGTPIKGDQGNIPTDDQRHRLGTATHTCTFLVLVSTFYSLFLHSFFEHGTCICTPQSL